MTPLGMAETAHLLALPSDSLRLIASLLLSFKQAIFSFGATCTSTQVALGEAIREAVPALADAETNSRIGWSLALGALHRTMCGEWRAVVPLRAVRAVSATCQPLQAAPRLSGATMCALGNNRLIVYGGRSADSGDTHDKLLMSTVTWRRGRGCAQWDELLLSANGPAPPARCYHSATQLGNAMVVFGGAGAQGVDDGDHLLADTWMLKPGQPTRSGLPGPLLWERLCCEGPAARSSHLAAAWSVGQQGEELILHGGLGSVGTLDDVWLLVAGEDHWRRLHTTGARVARAHHCGGCVGDQLLVHSGQDESLLTVEGVCVLHLHTARWESLPPRSDDPHMPPPRIDASAAAVGGVGLVVFGGMGKTFDFEEPTPWLLPAPWLVGIGDRGGDAGLSIWGRVPPALRAAPLGGGPCARACSAVCAAGPRVYVLGGFDGMTDLNDLWCLDLLPQSLHAATAPRDGTESGGRNALNTTDFRARQARQASVLHSTKAAAGHNCVPMHIAVCQAGAGMGSQAQAPGVEVVALPQHDEDSDTTRMIRAALQCKLGAWSSLSMGP